MKKMFQVLAAVLLCFCLAAGTSFSVSQVHAAEEPALIAMDCNGMMLDLPDMPILLSHYEENAVYDFDQTVTTYSNAWKFVSEGNAVLQVSYEAFGDSFEYNKYLEEAILSRVSDAEVVEEEDHTDVLFKNANLRSFFLMGSGLTGIHLSKNGVVILTYENTERSEEAAKAELKAIMDSIQFTEIVPAPVNDTVLELTISTEEETRFALENAALERPAEIQLTCSPELYEALSADNFAGMFKIAQECGLKDFGLRYSDSSFYLELSRIVYSDVPFYTWADTMEEAEAAVYQFVNLGLANFTVGCSGEVYDTLLNDRGIYTLLAKQGIGEADLRYTSSSLQLEDMKLLSCPYAVVDDIYSAADQIASWREEGLSRFALVYGYEVYNALTREDLQMIDFLGGVDRAHADTNSRMGIVTYGDDAEIEWSEGQSVYCASEEEIVDTIKVLGAQGSTVFQMMLPADLYEKLSADSLAGIKELESQAGIVSADLRYSISSSYPVFFFSNVEISADATMMESLEEVLSYVDECVARQDSEINLFLSAEVYNNLMSGLSQFQIGKSDAKIFDLIANAGIAHADWSYNRGTHVISMKEVQYYAGTRILLAVQNEQEDSLNDRDQETLAAAKALAEASQELSEVDTLKAIHDALCQMVVYTDDEETDEDDCAIGVLLNGEANCDGYADALYLVGRLAGLEVRYQHGDSVKQGMGSMFATHMWNLVKIDETWRLVDMTWDDQADGDPIYVWFNIGEDRAAKTHVWSREMTVSMDPETDSMSRFDPEYLVDFADGAAMAIEDAESNGYERYVIYASDESDLDYRAIRDIARDTIQGAFSYMGLDGLNGLIIMK